MKRAGLLHFSILFQALLQALEAPLHLQLRTRVDKDVLAVYSVTASKRSPAVLLYRDDDSFIWRVAVAKVQTAAEFESWVMRVR